MLSVFPILRLLYICSRKVYIPVNCAKIFVDLSWIILSVTLSFYWKMCFFDFLRIDTIYEKWYFLINLNICFAKFYIHKCKFAKVKPHFQVLKKEMELNIQTITSAKNKKAIKTVILCSQFNVFT